MYKGSYMLSVLLFFFFKCYQFHVFQKNSISLWPIQCYVANKKTRLYFFADSIDKQMLHFNWLISAFNT